MNTVKRPLEDASDTSSEAKVSKLVDASDVVTSDHEDEAASIEIKPTPNDKVDKKPPVKSSRARKKMKQKENRRKRAAANWDKYKGIKPDNRYDTSAHESTEKADDDESADATEKKKKKRMCAVFLSYSGKGYHGLQINGGVPTIERELLGAMVSTALLSEEERAKPQLVMFQRAARTDKGVSAARQVVSCKLPVEDGQEEACCAALNAVLPPQIRVMDIRRATRGFNSKNWCDFRTYSYLVPTFAFERLERTIGKDFRISEDRLKQVGKLLAAYIGTKNFHNYTIKKKATDPSANRFIHSFACEEPFIREGVEWVLIKVKGQSFMMHQIRKMIGMVISICRGISVPSSLEESLTQNKLDTPRAPALGLVLEQPHYEVYNAKFALSHKSLEWDGEALVSAVAAFRKQHIDADIISCELSEDTTGAYVRLLHRWEGRGPLPTEEDEDVSNGDEGKEDQGSIDEGQEQKEEETNGECEVNHLEPINGDENSTHAETIDHIKEECVKAEDKNCDSDAGIIGSMTTE